MGEQKYPESFGLAVRRRCMADIKSGLHSKATLVAELAVAIIVGIAVLRWKNGPGTDWEIDTWVLAAFITAIAAVVVHALWSYANAPRRLYNEMRRDVLAAQLSCEQEASEARKERLREVRKLLKDHASRAIRGTPIKAQMQQEACANWSRVAIDLLQKTVTLHASASFTPWHGHGGIPFDTCLNSFDAIAANLRVEDLKEI